MSSPESATTVTTATTAPAPLTLIIPGLTWPAQALADLTQGIPLPALTRLIRCGTLTKQHSLTTGNAVAQHLGLEQDCAGAALRRHTMGVSDQNNADDHWICLDPINLGFVERRLLVSDPQELALTAAEANALATIIAPIFSALGVIEVAAPHEWHLRLAPGRTAPATDALSAMIAKRADASLAALDSTWQQALNDAQIELHSHPVNKAREAVGRLTVNSVWPWGGAPLPAMAKRATNQAPITLYANAPELRGLASYLDHPVAPLPECWSRTIVEPALLVIDSLALPARRADAHRWHDSLTLIEQNWLAPLLTGLEQGKLKRMQIQFIGTPHGWTLTVSRAQLLLDRLAFWRAPQDITRLAVSPS